MRPMRKVSDHAERAQCSFESSVIPVVDFQPRSISSRKVHLWHTDPREITSESTLAYFYGVLSADEKAKLARYVFEEDRVSYLVGHAFVRLCLSQYAPVPPERWVFRRNAFGKPQIDRPTSGCSITYNLSHTNGLVACVVALGRPVGVDVEKMVPDASRYEIARKYFAPEEVRSLMHGCKDKMRHFYAYWTLKEAYTKAKGMGLHIPLNQFAFRLSDEGAPNVSFAAELCDDPRRWQFMSSSITSDHMCAVAIECEDAERVTIESYRAIA